MFLSCKKLEVNLVISLHCYYKVSFLQTLLLVNMSHCISALELHFTLSYSTECNLLLLICKDKTVSGVNTIPGSEPFLVLLPPTPDISTSKKYMFIIYLVLAISITSFCTSTQ